MISGEIGIRDSWAAGSSSTCSATCGLNLTMPSELVLSGFVRVATHPRVFKQPTPLDIALDFADRLRSHENAVTVAPGERHPYRSFQRHASMMPTGAHHTAIATTVRWT